MKITKRKFIIILVAGVFISLLSFLFFTQICHGINGMLIKYIENTVLRYFLYIQNGVIV